MTATPTPSAAPEQLLSQTDRDRPSYGECEKEEPQGFAAQADEHRQEQPGLRAVELMPRSQEGVDGVRTERRMRS